MDKVNIAFLVLLSGTKPNCSCDISGLRLLRILAIIILRSTLVKWLIKLIVLYSSHSIVPGILGRVMNTDFAKSLGILPLSYIEFRSFVKKSIPMSSRTANNNNNNNEDYLYSAQSLKRLLGALQNQ